MADHTLAQDTEQNGSRRPRPCGTRVCWLHIYGEEVLVGERVQLQEVELALEVGNVTAHWRACHTPPVPHTRNVPMWIHVARVLGLADVLSVKPVLLLSAGVTVIPKCSALLIPENRQLTVWLRRRSSCLMSERSLPIGMLIKQVHD